MKLKISIIWYWNKASQILPNWRDGLRAAIEVIGETHDVDFFLDERVPSLDEKYDAVLVWGDSNCPFLRAIHQYSGKKGIFLTTNPTNPGNLFGLDAIYCESTPVYEEVRRHGLRAIKAFGTDTAFFTPDETVKKDIEYFYPATFSPWKRQSSIAHLGLKLFCVGTLQPDGGEEFRACKEHHVATAVGYFPAEQIREYYQRTQKMIIPAVHGSERTMLEAMSMNIVPTVAPENVKAHSYLGEYRSGAWETPREFVLANYSPEIYAKNILKGIQ